MSARFVPFLRVHLLGHTARRSGAGVGPPGVGGPPGGVGVGLSHPSKQVASVRLHPQYQDFSAHYDLAVVALASGADVARLGTAPICMPGERAYVTCVRVHGRDPTSTHARCKEISLELATKWFL